MWREILIQAWISLRRNPTRSFLTMLGIVWGIAAVTLLLAYGDGFQSVMLSLFENFSKTAVIAFPGQTSMPAGGALSSRAPVVRSRVRPPMELPGWLRSSSSRWRPGAPLFSRRAFR